MTAGDVSIRDCRRSYEGVNQLRASIFPSLQRRGVRAIKKRFRSENGADGVVAHKLRFKMRFETLARKRRHFIDGCALSGLRGLRPPSAALRWLRDFLLMPQPPLLRKEGMRSIP